MALKNQIPPIETPELEISQPLLSGSFSEIKIDKVIYSNGSVNKVIDRSFSELISEEPPIDINSFFKQYSQLFYDIPKSGSKYSHFTLVEQSTEYLEGFEDPRDKEVEALLDLLVAAANSSGNPIARETAIDQQAGA